MPTPDDANYLPRYLRAQRENSLSEGDYREAFDPVKIKYDPTRYGESAGIYNNAGYIIIKKNSNSELSSAIHNILAFNENGG